MTEFMKTNTFSLSIVILHYNNFELTQNYITELKKQNWIGIERHIIVVDNNSPDGSGLRLNKYYKSSKDVDIVISKKNEGFARGNNLGIKKAVNDYCSDLIIVSNNDIEIPDTEFMQKVIQVYKRTYFDVMGPDIYTTRRNFHQSPIRSSYMTIEEIDNFVSSNSKKIKLLKIINKIGIYNLISFIKKRMKINPKDCLGYDKEQEGVVIQGAFFVLSKGYMSAYPDGLFSGTFLYMEEDILNYRVKSKNLRVLYTPELKVLHFEGLSTIQKNRDDKCKKYIFELEETNKSCQIMKKYLEEK